MNREQAINKLKKFTDGYASQQLAAEGLGIHRPHLTAMLSGKKKLSKRVLDKLHLRRVVTESYESL